MEKYNIGINERAVKIKGLIEEGLNLGVDLDDVDRKFKSVINTMNSETIRIAILGSFSDGKTSAIAGLLGRLEDDMKIDEDESSDELRIYRPKDLRDGFEIVDTPGLFGTKEKEIEGKNVKFSDITKRYISEAHIVIYVCDAVTPLKDSHKETIKWVMRDLGKLKSSIFVINKMDEAGFDLEDEADFASGCIIKKKNLISRLKNTIDLTEDEEKNIHIVCIAANPSGKGMPFWFKKSDDYQKMSHISDFRKEINDVVKTCDIEQSKSNTTISAINDMLSNVEKQIEVAHAPMIVALKKLKSSCDDLDSEIDIKSLELANVKKELKENIDSYRISLESEIKGASIETIQDVIDHSLGIQGDKVTFYVVWNKLNDYIGIADKGVANKLKTFNVKFQQEFNAQSEFLKQASINGAEALKSVKITNNDVKTARDIFKPTKKFKPYEAIKIGDKATKTLGQVAGLITIAIEAYDFIKQWRNNKKLDKAKCEIKEAIDNIFAQIYASFETEEIFLKNYATEYVKLCEEQEERKNELILLQKNSDSLDLYRKKIKEILLSSVQDVNFE